MSVLCEAISVIVRNEVLSRRYPGGGRAYRLHVPNRTWCTDGTLTRVGFMHPNDVARRLEHLAERGLTITDGRSFVEAAVVDQYDGPTLTCAWLEWGDGAAWLAGTAPGERAVPEGWAPSGMSRWDLDDDGRLTGRVVTEDSHFDPSGPHFLGRTDQP